MFCLLLFIVSSYFDFYHGVVSLSTAYDFECPPLSRLQLILLRFVWFRYTPESHVNNITLSANEHVNPVPPFLQLTFGGCLW